jgi:hypothetical protein
MAEGWDCSAPPPCRLASLFLLYKSHSWLPNLFIHIVFCYYKLEISVLNFIVEIHSIWGGLSEYKRRDCESDLSARV